MKILWEYIEKLTTNAIRSKSCTKFFLVNLSVLSALVVIFPVLFSCNFVKKQEPPLKPVARVYNAYLYETDIEGMVPKGYKPADSIKMVNDYIESWMKQQVILHQAMNNLEPAQINFKRQIEDYKNSLIIYEYEKKLVQEKLDTTVSEQEMNDYYNQNQKDFQLKNDIVKIIYVKVPNNAPNQDKLKNLVNSEDIKDKENLAAYCYRYAANYFLDDNVWLMFDDVLKEIPIQTYNEDIFLQNPVNHFVKLNDTADTYYLGIKGYMIKDSPSPISFEKENIKKIILNRRKLALIDSMRQNSFERAQGNNDVQLYK